ncbi:hypothetical protein DY000_02040191 [Brassica cretica]|uniref:Uncharacterized protein n=1 Tax=Brassica cretica TaxID=69181 RepID=A0ABQ7B4H4_BRACR|nr:hypothetical protein DY000_02040191 [Brassica cretica]
MPSHAYRSIIPLQYRPMVDLDGHLWYQEASLQHSGSTYGKSEHAQHRRRVTTDTHHASRVAGATREGTENPQIHDLEESDSEPEPAKEEPEKAATESSITAYL